MKPGDLVSHYRIDAKIGQGGMGEVFVAQDETLKRRVALKSIHAAHQLRSEARTRFTREARVLSQLDHPNICRIFDYIVGDEGDLIVLELIEGEPLNTAMHSLTYAQKLAVAEEIVSALVAAHAEGIVHRDLKPGNIMLTHTASVKVLDFGLARVTPTAESRSGEAKIADADGDGGADESVSWEGEADSISGFHTELGSVFGTVQFMSPEQARGDPVGPASDMFSLGLLLQELFTGQPARQLKRRDGLLRAAEGESNPISGVPRDLAQLITRMKERAASRRPTAVEALEGLRWILTKPQRLLKRALIAGALVVGTIGVTKYLIDLRVARANTEIKRKDAEAGRAYMLGRLYDLLKPLQRTGILMDVAQFSVDSYQAIRPDDLLPDEVVNYAQGWTLVGRVRRDAGNLADSLSAFESALKILDSQAAGRAPLPGTQRLRRNALFELAEVHQRLGDLDLAEQGMAPILELTRTAGWDDPLSASAWEGRALTKLGEIELARGKLDDADRHLAKAEASFSSLTAPTREERFLAGQVAFWRGYVEMGRDDPNAAKGPLQRYLDVSRALSDEEPGNIRWKVELAYGHTNLGAVYQARGDVEAARTEFRQVVENWRWLTYYDGGNAEWQLELADALSWLSTSELSGWHVAKALEPIQEEYRIREQLSGRDPLNMDWLWKRAICEMNQAGVFEALGREEEARTWAEAAVIHSSTLIETDASNSDWLRGHAVMCERAGRILTELSEPDAAEKHFNEAVRILAPELEATKPRASWLRMLATMRIGLAAVYVSRDQDERALIELDKVAQLLDSEPIRSRPDEASVSARARWHLLHGLVLQRRGNNAGAQDECRHALAVLEPIMWDTFSVVRAQTCVSATRIANGDEAVPALFDRFAERGYSPNPTKR